MRPIEKVSDELFEKLRTSFKTISLGNEEANATVDPAQARFFNFDFVVEDENYGNVTVTLADGKSLKVFYSKNITENIGVNKHKWYGFLKGLRDFAMRNMMTFDTRDINKDGLETRDLKNFAKAYVKNFNTQEVTESKMSNLFGSKKSSYQTMGPVRLIVRHSAPIDENKMGARSRNIQSIYVETQDGERFKVPTTNLLAGRVLARHVANGGAMHDAFGKHVMEMVNQLKEMRYFVLSSKRYNFEDATTKDMVDAAIESYTHVRETMHRLKGQRGYKAYMEEFTEQQQQEAYEMSEELRERFVKRIFDDRLSQAMPHIAKAYAARIKESNILSEKLEQFEKGTFNFGLNESDREMFSVMEFSDNSAFVRKILETIGLKLSESDEQMSKFANQVSKNWETVNPIQKEMATKLVRSFIKEVKCIKGKKTVQQETTMAENQIRPIAEGTWEIPRTEPKVRKLIDLLSRPLPAGTDGDNATNALYGVLGDDALFDAINKLAERNPEQDVRKLVISRLLILLAKPENIKASARELEVVASALEQIKETELGAAYADKIDMILAKYAEYATQRFSEEQGVAEGNSKSPTPWKDLDQPFDTDVKKSKDPGSVNPLYQKRHKKEEQGVAEGGTLKKIKRGLAGWGAFDKDSPKDVVQKNKAYDTDTLKLLKRGASEKPGPHSPRDLQTKVIDRELKRRGVAENADSQVDVDAVLDVSKRAFRRLNSEGGYSEDAKVEFEELFRYVRRELMRGDYEAAKDYLMGIGARNPDLFDVFTGAMWEAAGLPNNATWEEFEAAMSDDISEDENKDWDDDDISPYERRVRELEAEGMTRSDAQGIADMEDLEDWV